MRFFPPDPAFSHARKNFGAASIAGNAQELPTPTGVRAGAVVSVRGAVWHVSSVRGHPDCNEVRLLSPRRPGGLIVLTPFDRLRPHAASHVWQRAALTSVLATAAQTLAAADGTARVASASLRSPQLALLDWQLEPGLVLLDGRASRVLIADAVGLGKTVQAGFAEAFVCDDPVRDRTLILTPGGVRDQWCAELERLFGTSPLLMDAPRLRYLRRSLPPRVNPWSLPGIFVAGIDFVKQPEVLAGVIETRWTLVVLDEAHSFTRTSDRRRAAHLVARSARYVLLLTATPHSGDEDAFRDLCDIGSTGDQLLMLRRTRAHVGIAVQRRNRVLRVRRSQGETLLHQRLRHYLDELRRERLMDIEAAQLTAWVLLKRAASSAYALRTTLAHRHQVLSGRTPLAEQTHLPFPLNAGELTDDDVRLPEAMWQPGLRRRDQELERLNDLIGLASKAVVRDSKLTAARRFVLRIGEPVLLFTEFRDTLAELSARLSADVSVVTLHGSMSRSERRDAERAFARGVARVLVATDAASEGLNLHHTCRIVVNLDVPWNPVRLEQRIGRVDRIGQLRTVHAVTLVARDATEVTILERLSAKLHRIRRHLEGVDTLGLMKTEDAERPHDDTASGHIADFTGCRELAKERQSTLLSIVQLLRPAPQGSRDGPHVRGFALPWHAMSRRRRRRLGLPPGAVLLYRGQALTAAGSVAAVRCAAVLVEIDPSVAARHRHRRIVERCAAVAAATARQALHCAIEEALPSFQRRTERFRERLAAALEREGDTPGPYQPGLFDRRAMTAALRERAVRSSRTFDVLQTVDRLADDSMISAIVVEPIGALLLR